MDIHIPRTEKTIKHVIKYNSRFTILFNSGQTFGKMVRKIQ